MCNYCSNCNEEVSKDDASVLVTEDGERLCGTCNECELCRGVLNEHTSDFEQWICESCTTEEPANESDED